MNIMVVGCSPAGCLLAAKLDQLGCELSIVAENQADLDRLQATPGLDFHGLATLGRAIDVDILRSAGIESMDAVAAATENDNVNVMVCEIARDIFGIPASVALVADPSRKEVFSTELDMDVICPPALAADALASGLLLAHDGGSITFGSTTVKFVYAVPAPALIGHPLRDFRCPESHFVLGLLRRSGIFQPAAEAKPLSEGDMVVLWRVID